MAGRVEPLGCGFLLLASHPVVGKSRWLFRRLFGIGGLRATEKSQAGRVFAKMIVKFESPNDANVADSVGCRSSRAALRGVIERIR